MPHRAHMKTTFRTAQSTAISYRQSGTSKKSLNWNLWGNSVGARDFSPDGSTVISGLKSRAPTTTTINLLISFEFLEVPNHQFHALFTEKKIAPRSLLWEDSHR